MLAFSSFLRRGDQLDLDDESTLASSIENVTDDDLLKESGKLKLVIDLLEHLKETGHRTLVFSLSRKVLDMIHRILVNKYDIAILFNKEIYFFNFLKSFIHQNSSGKVYIF